MSDADVKEYRRRVAELEAEVERLRAALDGRGVVLRDAYNDATRTRDAHIRRAQAAEAEVRRLRALMAHPDATAVAVLSGLTLADLDEVGGMPTP